jgi:pyruvate dehydrogenase E2 component (dihydrolipoamide acetyltransferase)
MEVVVPDLGDFADVEVIEVLVRAGDTVAVEDPLIVLETDKATMEVPSSHAGTVQTVSVKAGQRVSAGDTILILEAGDAGANADTDTAGTEAPAAAVADMPAAEKPEAAPAQSVSAEARSVSEAVPDLGDFADVEVIDVLVGVGDSVAVDDPLIVLETDKATMEVPATQAGTVTAVAVKRGDRVSSGDAILTLESTGGAPSATPGAADPVTTAQRAAPQPAARQQPSATAAKAPPRSAPARAVDEQRFSKAHASPSVRKLARELGVDLGAVTGSGRKGRITDDDLKAFVKAVMLGGGTGRSALPEVPKVDFASFGEVETKPLTRIQKISGPRLHASWVNVPHVTQHDEADITELEAVRQELKAQANEQGVHLTPLAFIIRAVVLALTEFPVFRSSLAPDGESLVVKKYYHIGFAADTPGGLVVPVVRDADRLNLFGLAKALGDLSEKARTGKLASSDIQGGVFTVSSLGGIGGTFFTPIINAPEVAILGVSRSQRRPMYQDDALVPRLMLPLSLSYDHRVIDGATAVRFTTRLAELLGQGRKLTELTS